MHGERACCLAQLGALAALAAALIVLHRREAAMADTQKSSNPKPMPPKGDVDRVAMVSLRADGTPDQSEGFEVLIEAEDA